MNVRKRLLPNGVWRNTVNTRAKFKESAVEDKILKDQDGQLQGWLGVLNRVGILTPLPAGYGSVGTEGEVHPENCKRHRLGGWDVLEPAWHCCFFFKQIFFDLFMDVGRVQCW